MNLIKNFLHEEEGVTAIEYGLIAALVAVAIVAGASAVGISLSALFTNIGTCIATADPAICAAAV